MKTLPDFPLDTRFFVETDGRRWRVTRPYMVMDDNHVGAWDVYPDGRIDVLNSTYIEYCTTNCIEITREDALAIFRSLTVDMTLPEGF